jgi:hypothetical protein
MTPYTGLMNLPSFLVGVPMTKDINNNVYTCEFERGPIHAYGLRMDPNWHTNEPSTELIYLGTKYDGTALDVIN